MKNLTLTLIAFLLTISAFGQAQYLADSNFEGGAPPSTPPAFGLFWSVTPPNLWSTHNGGDFFSITRRTAASAGGGSGTNGNFATPFVLQSFNTDSNILNIAGGVAGLGSFVRVQFEFAWIRVNPQPSSSLTIIFNDQTNFQVDTIGIITTVGSANASLAGGTTFNPGNALPTGGVPNLGGSTTNLTTVSFSAHLKAIVFTGDQYSIQFVSSGIGTGTSLNKNQYIITGVHVFLDNFPLPITLAYFTGTKKDKNITLQWMTEKEDMLDRYEIEQSSNGADFTKIGTVIPHGINNPYEYNSECAYSGDVYFRLKSVDKDGKFEYSKTLNFKMEGDNAFTIFPNPVTDKVSVKGNFSAGKTYTVRIVNTLGQTLKMLDCTPSQDGVISLSQVDAIPQGVYILEVADNGGISRGQFVR